jgi:hypothetical protein
MSTFTNEVALHLYIEQNAAPRGGPKFRTGVIRSGSFSEILARKNEDPVEVTALHEMFPERMKNPERKTFYYNPMAMDVDMDDDNSPKSVFSVTEEDPESAPRKSKRFTVGLFRTNSPPNDLDTTDLPVRAKSSLGVFFTGLSNRQSVSRESFSRSTKSRASSGNARRSLSRTLSRANTAPEPGSKGMGHRTLSRRFINLFRKEEDQHV